MIEEPGARRDSEDPTLGGLKQKGVVVGGDGGDVLDILSIRH